MRALVTEPHGDRPVKYVTSWPDPEPDAGWVTVRVQRAALNRLDAMNVEERASFPAAAVLGSDAVGFIDRVGAGVETMRPGEPVIVLPTLWWGENDAVQAAECDILGYPVQGTHAEIVAVPAGNVFPKPARLDWDEAAAIPMAGLTAWRALVTRGGLSAGQTVVITAASSGVGSFAIQIAAALGARVVAVTSSPEKANEAMALGAADVVLRGEPGFAAALQRAAGGADLVLEPTGAGWPVLLSALRPGGRMVVIGKRAAEVGEVPVSAVYWRHLHILGSSMGSPRDFAALLDHLAHSRWSPVIDSVFPLQAGAEAYDRLDHPDRFGKVILDTTR